MNNIDKFNIQALSEKAEGIEMKTPIGLAKIIHLMDRQKGKCPYCKEKLVDILDDYGGVNIDHIIPKSMGGGSRLSNLALVDKWCNGKKADRTEEQHLKYLKPYLQKKCKSKYLLDNYWENYNKNN